MTYPAIHWTGPKTVWSPCYRAISEHFRDEFHDEALYKSTFFTLLFLQVEDRYRNSGDVGSYCWAMFWTKRKKVRRLRTDVAELVFALCCLSNITQRTDIVLLKAELVVADSYSVSVNVEP